MLAADIDVTSNPLLSNEISINDDGGGGILAISMIKLKKSFGNDNIFGYFLKLAFPLITKILALILNISIETNTFPDT